MVKIDKFLVGARNIFFNKTFWSFIFTTGFLLLLILYIQKNAGEFSELRLSNPGMFVLFIFAYIVNLYGTGRSMDAVLTPLGVSLTRFETFALASLSRLFNQIAPGRIGLAVRATYLKKKYKFPYANFASSLAAAHIVMYAIGAIAAIGALLYLGINDGTVLLSVLAVFLLLILASLLFSPTIPKSKLKIINHLSKALDGWYTIRGDSKTLTLTCLWMLVNIISQIFVFYSAFRVVGVEITIVESVFIASITLLGAVIAFTPGGFGITEGLVVVSAGLVGVAPSAALAVALVRRFVGLIIVLITSSLSIRKLLGAGLIETVLNYLNKKDKQQV